MQAGLSLAGSKWHTPVQKGVVGIYSRRSYHAHVRHELVCLALKEKCLSPETKVLVGNLEDLDEVWDAMTAKRNTSTGARPYCKIQ